MYDIIFISYNEPNADENFKKLKSRFPYAHRVHGIKGIHQAHVAAAKKAFTKMFWVVDGDAEILDTFNFDYEVSEYDLECVHVWRSKNPVNGLEYGYGGVKLLPKKLTQNMDVNKTDMTTSISLLFKAIDEVSNITRFNTDPFNSWKSAFRECVKLASKTIDRQDDAETMLRLSHWCTAGHDPNVISGAIAGRNYGTTYKDNVEALKKINDFDWLYEQFKNTVDTGTSKELLKKELNMKTMCAIPWMHLNFEPNGKVLPCCLTSPHNVFAGDLSTQTIQEIWNGDVMKTLRKQMIAGEEPAICDTCFKKEKVTPESGRYHHNREFKNVIKNIPNITLEDGTCTEMNLKYWDFRFSNLCNMKCRSCGPRYSSAWVPDARKLGWTDQEKVWNISSVDDKTNFNFLEDQIHNVEKIYFAGGEPLLMPEHWQILDMLVANKRFDVKLSYNTNASTLTYGKKNVLDYWSQWNNNKVEVWPSIDEIGERAELIRSGTVWSKVEENLKAMSSLENITVRPGMTMGAWNIFRFPEIIDHLINIGVITGKEYYSNFFINLLQYPSYYHVSILPDEFKITTIKKLENFITEYNRKYNTDITEKLSHILHELKQPFNESNARQFLNVTQNLDQVRSENLFNTIPEMMAVKNALQ